MSQPAVLQLEPDPGAWYALLKQRTDPPDWLLDARSESIEKLQLDGDGPIVATGHQAAVWHPGILAKDLAVMNCAAGHARTVHFVADHDANDPGLLHFPDDSGAFLQRRTWRALRHIQGFATGAQPAAAPQSLPEDAPECFHQLRRALVDHQCEESLGMQVARAVGALASTWTGMLPRRSLSALIELPVAKTLLQRMTKDPVACAETYNQAIKQFHRVARPLRIDGKRTELPLWSDQPDGRGRVHAHELDGEIPLRPRALFASTLMRFSCDLFVHGTGGARYDMATESWLSTWLGPEATATLAPRVSATTTILLPLEVRGEAMAPETLNRMRNDPPALLGQAPSPEKARLLESINTAPRNSRQRRSHFTALREWVAKQRIANSTRLETLQQDILDGREMAKARNIADARDWPFPLYQDAELDRLLQETQSAFSSGMRR